MEMYRLPRLTEIYFQRISAMKNSCSGHLAAFVHDPLDVSGGVNHAQIGRSIFSSTAAPVDRGSLNGDERPNCLFGIYCPEPSFHLLDLHRLSAEGLSEDRETL